MSERGWLRFDRDVVLRAGAGAGKTHALVSLYLHLVAGVTARRRPVPPSSIVAISFTEKAASELSQRIRQRLARLAAGDTSAEPDLVAAAAAEGVRLPDADGWERSLEQLGGAPVGTFHRLGGALLRRHAVAARIDPDYRQLDEGEAGERLRAAAERAVLEALEAGDEGARALVGELGYAASGRAMGLVDALVALHTRRAEEGRGAAGLDGNYAPAVLRDDVRAAATELLEALRALAGLGGLAARWTGIVRGIGAGLPALEEALSRAASATGSAESDAAAASVALEAARALCAPLTERAHGPGVKDAKQRALEALAGLEAAQRAFLAAPLGAALTRLLDDVGRRYAEDKRRLGALDFADLIVRARDLLRDHPSVRAIERARCEVLLVDEFQDTNAVQADLVRLLAGEARAGATDDPGDGAAVEAASGGGGGAGGRLLVVGDRKQSIYEFRGADVGVFVGFEQEIRGRGGALGVLARSYRSVPSLVRLSNALFARAFAPPAPGAPRWRIAWDAATDPLEPTRDPVGGDPDAPATELLRTPGGGSADDRRLFEAEALARRFAALQRADGSIDDAALLLRGFTHLDVYLEALRRAGVRYFVVNGRGFFEAQEVRDLSAALRLLDDPDDRLALLTALRSPLCHQSDETLLRLQLARLLYTDALTSGRAAAALPDPVTDDERGERERLVRFAALLAGLRRRADRLGPLGVLRALADGTDLEALLAAGYQGEQRVANFLSLCERARAAEEAGGDLRSFVRHLAELTEPGTGDREAQAQLAADRTDVLRVMTVHQSKGLQFRVVAVAACGAGEQRDGGPVLYDGDAGLGLKLRDGADLVDTPASRRVARVRAEKAQAESLRLFYVAATRARDLLLLSGETGRGPGQGSWRALLDGAVADDPEVARQVRVVELAPSEARAAEAEARTVLPPGDAADARALVERAAPRPPPPPPAPITVAVTQLADFALCPRRHHLLHVVGLAEHPRAARPAAPDSADPELDPLARGTLAHRLLELADPARAGDDLDALLRAQGYSVEAPEVEDVKRHVARFLATPFSRALAEDARHLEVRRELPFLLAEPGAHGAAVRLRGQIDLLVVDERDRSVTVVDYKHARAGDGDDYRFQLDAYALAARRLFPEATTVRTGLAFLREADPSPRLLERDAASIEGFARRLGAAGGELFAARAGGHYGGRPLAHCDAIGCGYRARCHPGAPPATGDDE